eukprot:3005696-Pleurochrysis_carterae.AAC.1
MGMLKVGPRSQPRWLLRGEVKMKAASIWGGTRSRVCSKMVNDAGPALLIESLRATCSKCVQALEKRYQRRRRLASQRST